jgi:hypothetical protein
MELAQDLVQYRILVLLVLNPGSDVSNIEPNRKQIIFGSAM